MKPNCKIPSDIELRLAYAAIKENAKLAPKFVPTLWIISKALGSNKLLSIRDEIRKQYPFIPPMDSKKERRKIFIGVFEEGKQYLQQYEKQSLVKKYVTVENRSGDKIAELLNEGLSYSDIARLWKVSRQAVNERHKTYLKNLKMP